MQSIILNHGGWYSSLTFDDDEFSVCAPQLLFALRTQRYQIGGAHTEVVDVKQKSATTLLGVSRWKRSKTDVLGYAFVFAMVAIKQQSIDTAQTAVEILQNGRF